MKKAASYVNLVDKTITIAKTITDEVDEIVGRIVRGGISMFTSSQDYKAVLVKTGTIVLDETTEAMLRADKSFMDAFKYHYGAHLSNDCIVSKIRGGKNYIDISDWVLYNKCKTDEQCMLHFQRVTGCECSGNDLINLKKQRKSLLNYVSRNITLVIDYFDLYREPKPIRKERSLSQDSMQRLADEKIQALDKKRSNKDDLTSRRRVATAEEEGQVMYLESSNCSAGTSDAAHDHVLDDLVDSDDDDDDNESTVDISALAVDSLPKKKEPRRKHINVRKLLVHRLIEHVPALATGVWIRIDEHANTIEWSLLDGEPEGLEIHVVDTIYRPEAAFELMSSEFMDVAARDMPEAQRAQSSNNYSEI